MPLYTCRKSAAKLPCHLWAKGTRERRSFEMYRTRDAPKLCLVGVGQCLGKPKPELNYPSPLVLGCSLNACRLIHGPTLKKKVFARASRQATTLSSAGRWPARICQRPPCKPRSKHNDSQLFCLYSCRCSPSNCTDSSTVRQTHAQQELPVGSLQGWLPTI